MVLNELGHPQPATPIQVDNTTAVGFANNRIKQKATKALDMRFHWIRDRVKQNQFVIYWAPGTGNYADYVSKFHSPAHNTTMRSKFFVNRVVCTNNVISCLLRGCNNPGRITVPRSADLTTRQYTFNTRSVVGACASSATTPFHNISALCARVAPTAAHNPVQV